MGYVQLLWCLPKPRSSSTSSEWDTFGAGDGEFNGPNGVAVASDGSVYVSDRNNHRAQKFSPAPQPLIMKW